MSPHQRLGDALARFRSGDPLAFDEIVDAHAPAIVRTFRRLGADPSTAEDLAQEVFVRLLRTRAAYEARGRLAVYLDRVARNVWVDHVRARVARPEASSIDAPAASGDGAIAMILAHPGAGPAEALSGRDAARALAALLAKLPEGERAVLELAVFEGLRYAEIADELSIPEGTVKSRVFSAVRRLRAAARASVDLA
ncbi:MAG TPA: sigma-70 family RNA polymerase sigma factor [Planctomycetota bacterium]|nr:sigma-70 family RNA polymerase sigma factor [Planctomycetota bacterium]